MGKAEKKAPVETVEEETVEEEVVEEAEPDVPEEPEDEAAETPSEAVQAKGPDAYAKLLSSNLERAAKAARSVKTPGVWRYEFKRPFQYGGCSYEVLHFDFGSVTGLESMKIYSEARELGYVILPNLTSHDIYYAMFFAAKACREKLPAKAFLEMPAAAFNSIVGNTSSFLQREAQP